MKKILTLFSSITLLTASSSAIVVFSGSIDSPIYINSVINNSSFTMKKNPIKPVLNDTKYYLNDTFKDQKLIDLIISSGNVLKDSKGYYLTQSVCDSVYTLVISGKNVKDFSGIQIFSNLISLNLANNNAVINFNLFLQMNSLQSLFLNGNNQITNIGDISNTSINYLDIANTNLPINFETFNSLVNNLNISNDNITNFDSFKDLSLQTVKMNNIKTDSANILTPIAKTIALKSIIAQGDNITTANTSSFLSTKNIRKFAFLQDLNLSNNHITGTNNFKDLLSLSNLNLSYNYIPNTDAA